MQEYYIRGMRLALMEAEIAYEKDEVPVGAVLMYKNKIISKAHNLVETLQDSTAHAEMLALTSAMNKLGSKFLQECTLFVTLEPCVMCAGAMYWTRVGVLVYGAKDEKRGFASCKCNILHPKTLVISGILEQECSTLITEFFQNKR